MSETLRTRDQLLTLFEDGQEQGVTAEKQRDLIVSLAGVGAGESTNPVNDGAATGLIRLGAKKFQVDVNGDGTYLFAAQGDADIDIEATVRVGFTVNDDPATASYIARPRFYPGQQNTNHVILLDRPARPGWDGTGNPLIVGDIIELKFDPTGGATISNPRYFIFGIRQ